MTEDVWCEPGDCKAGRLRIVAVLLAAGEGARLGGRAKGAIEIEGEPLLLRGLRILSEVGVDEVVVVTGHYQSDLAPLLLVSDNLPKHELLVDAALATATVIRSAGLPVSRFSRSAGSA